MATRSNRNQSRNTKSDDQNGSKSFKIVYGIVDRGESSFWTRIGAAFENRDGSLNIRLDYLPTAVDTTLQVREPRERDEE